MANRYWVGGSGSWDGSDTAHWASSSGGAGGETGPTASDDVIFVSSSGTAATVTITTTAALANTVTINKADLILLHNAGSTITGALTLTSGTLNTNGQSCTWGSFASAGGLSRAVLLGSSNITINGAVVSPWAITNTTNLSFDAGTSSITSTYTFPNHSFNNLAYYDFAITNIHSQSTSGTTASATFTGNATFHNFTITNTAAKSAAAFGGNIVVTGTFTVTGTSAVNRILCYSGTAALTRTVTAAAISLTNVDFQDITAAGVAAPFTGTSIGDALSNSNITFDAPTTQTWQGSSGGNWSDVSKWTSRVPLPQDDVVIASAFSASQTITADMPRLGKDIDWSGSTGNPTWSINRTNQIYGSVNISGVGSITATAVTTYFAGRGLHTLTSGGRSFSLYGQINAGGTYTLNDSLTMNNLVVAGVAGSTFSANNFNVTIANFQINNGCIVTMGSGTWSLTGTIASPLAIWNCTSAGATVNADTSTILLAAATASNRLFNGAGKTYHTLSYTASGSTGELIIAGSNTFDTINFSDASNSRTLRFTSGTTTTIQNSFNVQGSLANPATINATTPASAATLTKTSGTISCDYLSIQDSTATGGAAWYAGANSDNVSGNTGWIFSAADSGRAWFTILSR